MQRHRLASKNRGIASGSFYVGFDQDPIPIDKDDRFLTAYRTLREADNWNRACLIRQSEVLVTFYGAGDVTLILLEPRASNRASHADDLIDIRAGVGKDCSYLDGVLGDRSSGSR